MAKHVEDRLESKRAEDAVAIAEDDEEDERNNRYVVLCMRFVCVCVCVCVCVWIVLILWVLLNTPLAIPDVSPK